MRLLLIALAVAGFAGISTEVCGQSSIPTPRTQTLNRNEMLSGDSIRKSGDSEESVFGAAGLSVRPTQNPQFNLEAKVLRIAMFGRPDVIHDAATGKDTYKEHISYEFLLNSYVVDAVGSLSRGVREYVVSKKGSPISINMPAWSWNTKKGDVRQFWTAGQLYGEAKAIPLADSSQAFIMNGSVGLGYTQQVNLDLLVGDSPGNIFLEASAVGAGIFGKNLVQNLRAESDKSVGGIVGVDWRVGLQILGSDAHAISLSGTAFLTKIKGNKGKVSIGYSKSVR